MHPNGSQFALVVGAVLLISCADRIDPLEAVAPIDVSALSNDIANPANVPTCGFENGRACPVFDEGLRCDVGLSLDLNETPAILTDDICVNDSRHLAGPGFRSTWAHWALANQRTLAIDEPINWVMHLSTHNAFNNLMDGYVADPNQVFSMSDQLDLGSRFLWLDLHWKSDAVRLCHSLLVCGLEQRRFAFGMQEVAAWLAANPGEIVMMDFEAYVEGHFDEVADPLKAFFGDKLFEKTDRIGTSWPSRRELLRMGKHVIIGARGGDVDLGADDFRGKVHRNYNDGRQDIRLIKNFEVVRTNGIVTSCGGRGVDDTGPPGLYPLGINDHQFWVVGEDRTLLGVVVPASGYVQPSDVVDLVTCNVPTVSLDLLSAPRCLTIPRCLAFWSVNLALRAPNEERQPYAVWSWRDGDRGDAGDAALLHGSDGRWTSATPSGQHRFACALPRSETSRTVADWTDALGVEWRVTSRAGPWKDGGRACLDEYGEDGFVYSAPVNGRMNGRLRLANQSGGDVWVNYNDIKEEGSWVINQRPVARGVDRVVECSGHNGTPVELDGSSSTDPDGDQLSFEWQGPFGTVTGVRPTVVLQLGRHVIRMIADDGFGGVSVDEVVIEVVDTTPPEIRSATATPSELWPPNHRMVPATITVDVHDVCDPTPTCRIVSVASNEAANGTGDGNTAPDWEITGPLTLNVRAERSGKGSGRVYTITVECTDHSGNASTTDVTVTVPHDQGRP
jgi:hypothetical protein